MTSSPVCPVALPKKQKEKEERKRVKERKE
jgi:hypothetical protein